MHSNYLCIEHNQKHNALRVNECLLQLIKSPRPGILCYSKYTTRPVKLNDLECLAA